MRGLPGITLGFECTGVEDGHDVQRHLEHGLGFVVPVSSSVEFLEALKPSLGVGLLMLELGAAPELVLLVEEDEVDESLSG